LLVTGNGPEEGGQERRIAVAKCIACDEGRAKAVSEVGVSGLASSQDQWPGSSATPVPPIESQTPLPQLAFCGLRPTIDPMSVNLTAGTPAIAALCREYAVHRLSVFGSAARNTMNADSDIDLLVEFEPGQAPSLAGFARLKTRLGEVLGTDKIDLATPSILRNPYRRRTILRDLTELYAA
jgi:predicted nucleotidyltransferase